MKLARCINEDCPNIVTPSDRDTPGGNGRCGLCISAARHKQFNWHKEQELNQLKYDEKLNMNTEDASKATEELGALANSGPRERAEAAEWAREELFLAGKLAAQDLRKLSDREILDKIEKLADGPVQSQSGQHHEVTPRLIGEIEERLNLLHAVSRNDIASIKQKEREYGGSWKRRGGVGAFMMLARKWDRLENAMEHQYGYDIFKGISQDNRAEGIIDDIRDLRRYLMLVEAEMVRQGVLFYSSGV